MGDGQTGAALVEAGVDKISFTGSVATGRKVAEACGRQLLPVTLELGGKDAMIVCADADLDRAAAGALLGSCMNTGQYCCGTERIYAVDEVYERVRREGRGRRAAAAPDRPRRVGHRRDLLGPPARDHREPRAATPSRRARACASAAAGIRSCAGSTTSRPCVTDVTHEMDLMRHETFGPVVAIMRVADEEEALRLANDSRYGLNGNVWTRDKEKGFRIAERMETGGVCINDMALTYGVPEAPFGGVKDSGVGQVNGAARAARLLPPAPDADRSLRRQEDPGRLSLHREESRGHEEVREAAVGHAARPLARPELRAASVLRIPRAPAALELRVERGWDGAPTQEIRACAASCACRRRRTGLAFEASLPHQATPRVPAAPRRRARGEPLGVRRGRVLRRRSRRPLSRARARRGRPLPGALFDAPRRCCDALESFRPVLAHRADARGWSARLLAPWSIVPAQIAGAERLRGGRRTAAGAPSAARRAGGLPPAAALSRRRTRRGAVDERRDAQPELRGAIRARDLPLRPRGRRGRGRPRHGGRVRRARGAARRRRRARARARERRRRHLRQLRRAHLSRRRHAGAEGLRLRGHAGGDVPLPDGRVRSRARARRRSGSSARAASSTSTGWRRRACPSSAASIPEPGMESPTRRLPGLQRRRGLPSLERARAARAARAQAADAGQGGSLPDAEDAGGRGASAGCACAPTRASRRSCSDEAEGRVVGVVGA